MLELGKTKHGMLNLKSHEVGQTEWNLLLCQLQMSFDPKSNTLHGSWSISWKSNAFWALNLRIPIDMFLADS